MSKQKPVNIDADLRNADWIRTRSWDLPTDKDMFLTVIGGAEQLDHFMTLPAAEAMPDQLRIELGVAPKDAQTPTETSPHKPHPVKRLRVRDDGDA